jgi:uncharacterized repeat protein (TIGR01451 family)/LPXTG-motif cell wall-anchored protein
MSKLFSLVKHSPKRIAAVLTMIALAVIVPATLFAWGPDRPTYTIANPADHITFNSITDNPSHGDERNFVQVREANAGNETYDDSISLAVGHEYVVYVYFHNNAASNLNLVANGSYVRAEIPAVVSNGASDVKAVGYVGASNATPNIVWDDISFANTTGGDIALRFVPGSTTIHSFGAVNGQTMSDSIVTTGASIGYNALDGNVPGCNEYAGYVTFRVKADQPNFTIEKEVRIAGTETWSDSVSAKAGDTIEYIIGYTNTGTTTQNDVVISDILPAHVSYVKGSTTLKNANYPSGKTVSDNLTKGGINIGSYTAGSNAYVKFKAIVDGSSKLDCGTNKLTNTANAETNNGTKSDTAVVIVKKTCTTPNELPKTGAGDSIIAILGLGATVTSAGYYIASRRALLNR